MRARVFLLGLAACGGAQTEVTTPPTVAVVAPAVAEAEESAVGGSAHAQIGNVRVALDVVEDERERFSFDVTAEQARALGGSPRERRAIDFVDIVEGAYPLPSERVYEAVEAEAQSACMNEDYDDDDDCSADLPRCYDRLVLVEDASSNAVLEASSVAFLCGEAYDDESTAGVTTHDLEGGGSVFVIVWDDTEEDPGGRCGCNPEARDVHVVVLNAEGAVLFQENAGYQISTCPLGNSDEYRVVWRDVDGDGVKELVGEVVLSFSPPEEEGEYEEEYSDEDEEYAEDEDETYEEEAPAVRAWFVRSFAAEAARAPLPITPDRCLRSLGPTAPATASPAPRPQARAATRRARASRPPRQSLHVYANACECGAMESCIDLSQAFRALRKNDWADAAEERAVFHMMEHCLERSPSDCMTSLDERELPTVSRARARAIFGGFCAEGESMACLAAARMDFQDGIHMDAAVSVLGTACEDGPVYEACEMLRQRPGPEGVTARRMLCALGSYAECAVSTSEARASGRELTLREQTFDHACPSAP